VLHSYPGCIVTLGLRLPGKGEQSDGLGYCRETSGQSIDNDSLQSYQKGNVMTSKIRPVGDRVVVKPAQKEEVTKSGIVIPDTAKEKPQEGTIIAVGTGKINDKGDRTPLEVREGDRVLFAKYGGTEFKYNDEDLLVLRESDILAVLE
jgi:chaperonin GroES